jgi:hypothetical protein
VRPDKFSGSGKRKWGDQHITLLTGISSANGWMGLLLAIGIV